LNKNDELRVVGIGAYAEDGALIDARRKFLHLVGKQIAVFVHREHMNFGSVLLLLLLLLLLLFGF
jgi:hypothetical protein